MPIAPERKQQTRERIVGAAAGIEQERLAEVTIGEIMAAAGSRMAASIGLQQQGEAYAEAVDIS